MIAACSGGGPDAEEAAGEEGDASGPASTDVFVHAADDEPTTLDPAAAEPGEGAETHVLQSYERLIEISPEGPDLVPALSTEVPTDDNGLISEDGLTYTFPIREGVVFHDGTDLSAEDVKYSWDRVMELDLPGSNAGMLTEIVAETAVVDDFTFEVTLLRPSAAFLNSVVTQPAASIVSQDAVEANGGIVAGEPNQYMTGNMVGTGALRLVEWNRDENLRYEVFEDYWGEPAHMDVRVDIVQDPDVRILGLRAGDYDTIETDPSLIPDLEGAENVTIYTEGLLLEPIHVAFNLNIDEELLPAEDTIPADFFHDPLIRQAFNHAFDYEAFVAGALGGFGDYNPHYLPMGIFGYDEDAPRYSEQNLERAEELFREAGVWDEGFTVSVITEAANLFETAALILKDSIESLNPDFEIRVLAVAEAQFDEAHASEPMPYAMWVKNADPAADPHAYMFAYQHPEGPWGQVHGFAQGYQDPDRIAELIDMAEVEIDEPTRAGYYAELQELLYEDPMWLIAAQEGLVMAHGDWVDGFVMNPLWPRPSLKFALLDKSS
ncbi:MAG TPA: ABC transporter substrate-binding protein [Egicoccus sp.]|nr:ABC transporter substrate-binding protein [Egicoccus sp.]HSK23385.1 ABC transporter substrate-binding protein [Egicoccus sp.]